MAHEPQSSGLTRIIANFVKDREDLIRMLVMDALLEYFPRDKPFILECFRELLKANSWRISTRVCQLMDTLCGILTKAQFRAYIQESYLGFLGHSEPELRAAACSCLGKVCLSMELEDIVGLAIPLVVKLSQDPSELVKSTSFLTQSRWRSGSCR